MNSQVQVSAGSPRAGWLSSTVLTQLKDPLLLFRKCRKILRGSGFLSRRDMTLAVESEVKPHSFIPAHFQCKYIFNKEAPPEKIAPENYNK